MRTTFLAFASALLLLAVCPLDAATRLAVADIRFTMNGSATFLHGISYYGALSAPEDFIRRDLDDMQRLGINWIRVWATWGAFDTEAAALDDEGEPVDHCFSKLEQLVAECDRRGIVVDITLHRHKSPPDEPGISSMQGHRRAVETVATALKTYRNWYLDLANERNIGDARFVSYDELRELRDLLKRLDPDRLVTASQGGDIGRDELRKYIEEVGVDFICPHRGRSSESPAQTKSQTEQYLAWMKEIGRLVPVHYQEPFRRGYTRGWEPKADDFVTDALGAKAGGAAGWCLHNGDQRGVPENRPRRSFDMTQARLFDQLDYEEITALRRLAPLIFHSPPDEAH